MITLGNHPKKLTLAEKIAGLLTDIDTDSCPISWWKR